MLWSIPVATIAGTVVRVHVTFLLFLVWIGGSYWRVGGQAAAIEGVLFILLLFACVLAHEFGHIVAARRYGIHTPDVTLWPIGGVASLERIPDKPREELVVALAGPAVNVIIAFVLILFLGTSLEGAAATELDNPRTSMLGRLAAANIFLVVFNMIPAFPMDGGRVLRALIAMRRGHAEATRIAGRIGQLAAFVFALVGLFTNPMLIVIGLFVYLAATAETQHVAFRDGTKGLAVREAMMSKVDTLSPSATLDDAVNCLIRTSQKGVSGGGRLRPPARPRDPRRLDSGPAQRRSHDPGPRHHDPGYPVRQEPRAPGDRPRRPQSGQGPGALHPRRRRAPGGTPDAGNGRRAHARPERPAGLALPAPPSARLALVPCATRLSGSPSRACVAPS